MTGSPKGKSLLVMWTIDLIGWVLLLGGFILTGVAWSQGGVWRALVVFGWAFVIPVLWLAGGPSDSNGGTYR